MRTSLSLYTKLQSSNALMSLFPTPLPLITINTLTLVGIIINKAYDFWTKKKKYDFIKH